MEIWSFLITRYPNMHWLLWSLVYTRGPQPPGPWPSSGTQPVRNRAAQQKVSSERAKLHLLPPHRWHYCLNHPPTSPPHRRPWTNCLPRNRSLVPKRLGTAGLYSQQHPPYSIPRPLRIWFYLSYTETLSGILKTPRFSLNQQSMGKFCEVSSGLYA